MNVCPVDMSDHKPCGRPLFIGATGAPDTYCLMHARRQDKPLQSFLDEVDKLMGFSSTRSTLGVIDFKGFYFPSGSDFKNKVFLESARFVEATFSHPVDFSRIRFAGGAAFNRTAFAG